MRGRSVQHFDLDHGRAEPTGGEIPRQVFQDADEFADRFPASRGE
jgi:hypothetical protein